MLTRLAIVCLSPCSIVIHMTSSTVATTDPMTPATDDRVLSTLKLVAPVGLGLFPLGIGFGVLIIHAGLPWWWAPVFTGLIYAGSLEFLLIPMALAATPLAAVAATALVVNSRHVFYALSFPLHQVRGRLARTYATFGLTDEAYALTAGPEAQTWTTKRIVVLQLLLQSFWVAGATVGALAGTRLPLDRLQGLDFALTALFVVLAIEAFRATRDLPTAGLAVVCAVAAQTVLPQQMLLVALSLFAGLLVARSALATRKPAHA
jgi:4-azaleucine resistance transporter AzlC